MLGIDPPATAATAEPPLPTTVTTATPNNSVTPTRSEPHTNNSVLSDANGVPDLESTDGFNTSYDVTSNNQSISSDNDETSSQTSINEGPIYWTTFNSNLHDPNTGRPKVSPCQCSLHTSAIYNKRLYIFGGYDGSSRTNDFYEFCFEPVRMRGWRVIPPSIIPQGRDARDRDRLNPLNQHHQHQHHHHGDNSPDLHIPTPPNRQTSNNGQILHPGIVILLLCMGMASTSSEVSTERTESMISIVMILIFVIGHVLKGEEGGEAAMISNSLCLLLHLRILIIMVLLMGMLQNQLMLRLVLDIVTLQSFTARICISLEVMMGAIDQVRLS